MKKLALLLLIPCSLLAASLTTRMGMTKPDDGQSGWGTTVRNNYDIIDSSAAILSSTQTFTGTNTFSTISVSSQSVNGPLNIVGNAGNTGNINLTDFASIEYGIVSPTFILDLRGDGTEGTAVANFQDSNGIALQASDTSNNPAISASNNTSGTNAYAVKASKVGGSGVALFSTVDVSTAASFSATSGTAGLFSSGSGNALQVDKGSILLRPLTASQFVTTDASKNLVSADLYGGTNAFTGINTFSTSVQILPGGIIRVMDQANNGDVRILGANTYGATRFITIPDPGIQNSHFILDQGTNVFNRGSTIINSGTDTYSLAVGTTSTGPYTLDVSTTGHINSQAVTGSTVTSCGSGATVVGSDVAGTITTGTGAPTACTLTFAKAYTNTPVCLCGANGATACDPTSTSATAVTFTLGLTETTIKYICLGRD